MPLTPGSRLGPYEIVAPLSAGGIGEVPRARDPRLKRGIAIKVLPADVTSSPDHLARLEREATTVAGLNHPNIVVLHSVEEDRRRHDIPRSDRELRRPAEVAIRREFRRPAEVDSNHVLGRRYHPWPQCRSRSRDSKRSLSHGVDFAPCR